MRTLLVPLLLLICADSVLAQEYMTDPYYTFPEPSTIQIPLLIKSDLDRSILNNLGGISGEMHYDATVFHNPRIVPTTDFGSAQPTRKACGMMIEPGVYRFTVYASPIESLIQTRLDVANFTFTFDDRDAWLQVPKAFTFEDCKAAKRTESGATVRKTYDVPIALAPVVIKNSAADWLLYE